MRAVWNLDRARSSAGWFFGPSGSDLASVARSRRACARANRTPRFSAMKRPALSWSLVLFALLVACSGDDGQVGDDGGRDPDSGAGGSSPDGGPDTVVPDPCEGQAPECPAQTGVDEGSGLAAVDRCAFPMQDTGT